MMLLVILHFYYINYIVVMMKNMDVIFLLFFGFLYIKICTNIIDVMEFYIKGFIKMLKMIFKILSAVNQFLKI